MMFAGTNRGKERYLTIMMNSMVKKLYDNHEYTLYDIVHDRLAEGELADDSVLEQALREFRTECFYDLLEAFERQYEGISETVEGLYHGMGINSMGLNYQNIIRFGIDIDSAYILFVNALLEDNFDGTSCPDGREDFYEAFCYNMELFPQLEQAAIDTSMELLKEDGYIR